MKLIYPAIFTKDENAYYVTFPDLQGCQTFGDTIPETYENSKEALLGYCSSFLDNGEILPKATPIEDIKFDENSFISFVEIYIKDTNEKAIKKTLTIPSWLNDIAIENNINFSQTLKEALMQRLELN